MGPDENCIVPIGKGCRGYPAVLERSSGEMFIGDANYSSSQMAIGESFVFSCFLSPFPLDIIFP